MQTEPTIHELSTPSDAVARYPVTASFPDPVSPRAERARECPTRRLASRIESPSVAQLMAIAPLD